MPEKTARKKPSGLFLYNACCVPLFWLKNPKYQPVQARIHPQSTALGMRQPWPNAKDSRLLLFKILFLKTQHFHLIVEAAGMDAGHPGRLANTP